MRIQTTLDFVRNVRLALSLSANPRPMVNRSGVGSRFPVEVAALERRAPGLTNAGVWGAIDVAALREAGIDLSPNAALVDLTESGSVTAADTVAALREHFKERATITAYDERVAQLSEAPTATALRPPPGT